MLESCQLRIDFLLVMVARKLELKIFWEKNILSHHGQESKLFSATLSSQTPVHLRPPDICHGYGTRVLPCHRSPPCKRKLGQGAMSGWAAGAINKAKLRA